MNHALKDGTVGKALLMLDIIADAEQSLRFNNILALSPFPKATTYRLLQTMTSQAMLSYDAESQKYSLGMRLVRLAHHAWKQASLGPIASPYLNQLASEVGETVHLAQIENGQVLFIDKRHTSQRFETLAQVGRIAPAHCTGVGKVMLAYMQPERQDYALQRQTYIKFTNTTITNKEALLDELITIKREGVAYDKEEHENGIISIAAPILTSSGQVMGAISIATSTSRHTVEDLTQYRGVLDTITKAVSTEAELYLHPTSGS
ncbi:MAG: IclR family transcriptional regulator [Pseudomonadales bacterium]|jgi:DNA-binding IclR family transcriptional regulator|tara:strand:- start:2118 stop:2903 length:786 start_codon:yes stop_codon:yes gene_type:complete